MNNIQIMNLHWWKCSGEIWCDFLKLNLNHSHFEDMEGVYIIWHGGNNPKTVYIGQGIIKDCLKRHREETEILNYRKDTLYVTWASVNSKNIDGVEKYLANQLSPLVGKNFPNVIPIEVNLPW